MYVKQTSHFYIKVYSPTNWVRQVNFKHLRRTVEQKQNTAFHISYFSFMLLVFPLLFLHHCPLVKKQHQDSSIYSYAI